MEQLEQPLKIDLVKVKKILKAYNNQIAKPQGYKLTFHYGLNVAPVSMLITVRIEDREGKMYRGFIINLYWRQPLEQTLIRSLDYCIGSVQNTAEVNVDCAHRAKGKKCGCGLFTKG